MSSSAGWHSEAGGLEGAWLEGVAQLAGPDTLVFKSLDASQPAALVRFAGWKGMSGLPQL